jgi:Fe-coproporphyrin III synthase
MQLPRLMRTPRIVEIEITSECNLRCKYCYFFGDPQANQADLPLNDWLRFIDELGQLGVMEVILIGGEPFIYPHLVQVIEAIVTNRMRFSIVSNGSLIDNQIAAFIAETHRCNSVQISLDGAEASIHDALRGQGSFRSAVRGIRTLQRHDILTSVRLTIHKHNVDHLAQITEFLLTELDLPSFSTNSAGYLGTCRGNCDDILLSTSERENAMIALLALEKHYPGRILAAAGPLAEAHMWEEMETKRRSREPGPKLGGTLSGCGCTFNRIAVRPDGVIIPCTLLAQVELGRINQNSLADLWLESPQLTILRNRRFISLSEFEGCQDCDYSPYCTGNCPGLAHSLVGEVNQPSPDACLRLYLEDGGQFP